MLVKEKTFTESPSPRIRAGETAEKEMAFLLQRRFGNDPSVFIINDLRIEHSGSTFQIDHLLVTQWGLFIIESKSVHCPVTIKVWDEKREHWSRNFAGKIEGFASPVLQAEEQARLLKEFLIAHKEKMLGKLIGLLQKGFSCCPIIPLVAISASGIIRVESGSLHKSILKADEIGPEITRQIAQLKKKARFFNPSLATGWSISEVEAAHIARLLTYAHTPRRNTQTRIEVESTSHPIQEVLPEAAAIPPVQPTGDKTQKDSEPKYYCYRCKVAIPKVVAKYCFERTRQFGGRAYCRSCQSALHTSNSLPHG